MKHAPYAWLAAATAALAFGSAHAADKADKQSAKSDPPGFNEMDKNNDGFLSKAEGNANPTVKENFAEMDGDGDGKLSRGEYLKKMAAQDFSKLREKAAGIMEKDEKSATGSGSASGSGSGSGSGSSAAGGSKSGSGSSK